MTLLQTNRLLIRNFRASDWEALHAMICLYQASELAAYDQPWPTSPEQIKSITEWFAGGDGFLAVCLKGAGQLIGFVALNEEPHDGKPVFNLGYVFHSDYHGQGYASEACRAVLAHAFERLQAQRVVSGAAAANHASCRLLERLGFQKTAEGTGSFRTTADGTPIRFLGYTFELSQADWQRVGLRQTL
jgi:RimJ/RimL family protein N-acetyltransferase